MSEIDWVSKWLEHTRDDLLVAQKLFYEFHPKQLEISCYHCQQAAEKALKAYLVSQGATFAFTHNLGLLCQLCADIDAAFDDIADDCNDLTQYATQTRYPAIVEIEEAENQAALKKAERVVTFCEEKIGAAQ